MSQKGFGLLTVIITILVGILLFLLINSKYNVIIWSLFNNFNKSETRNIDNKCTSYGLLDSDFYLNKYTVNEGDTLLSIAKNELGDSSRVDELIQLNETYYPGLSIQNPFIEIGWQLRIPPKFFPRSSGIIQGEAGKILESREDAIVINLKSDQVVKTISYKTSQTKYLGNDSLKPEDCVYIIKDIAGRAGAGMLAVSSQDKNYFKEFPSQIKTPEGSEGKCSFYGYLDKDFYLDKYTAQKRDTVFSIAQDKLGDSSRMNEIIELNKAEYPHLSISNPFIEIGWQLWLPTKMLPTSSGVLVGSGGEILKVTDKWISISLTENIPEEWQQPGVEYGHVAYRNPKTKYAGLNSLKTADCVYVVEDTGINENYMIIVSPQDKNYLKP